MDVTLYGFVDDEEDYEKYGAIFLKYEKKL